MKKKADCTDYKTLTSGILNKTQIEYAFKNHELIDCFFEEGLQPCSYDLRIGTIYKNGDMIEKDNASVDVQPGEMITIHTLESLKLPNDIAATVFPINSQSSEGLMVLNPGHIDPGYEGIITVKAINLRKNPLSLMLKDKIFTIIFEKIPTTTIPYNSNVPNEAKKRGQLKKERDISPGNLFNIPKHLKKNTVFAYTESDVHRVIARNALSWATVLLALLAVLISVSSFIMATCSYLKDGRDNIDTSSHIENVTEEKSINNNFEEHKSKTDSNIISNNSNQKNKSPEIKVTNPIK